MKPNDGRKEEAMLTVPIPGRAIAWAIDRSGVLDELDGLRECVKESLVRKRGRGVQHVVTFPTREHAKYLADYFDSVDGLRTISGFGSESADLNACAVARDRIDAAMKEAN
jgi:hypothetical protein